MLYKRDLAVSSLFTLFSERLSTQPKNCMYCTKNKYFYLKVRFFITFEKAVG